MQSYVGRSSEVDSERAVQEITWGWPAAAPDLLLVFSSTRQDAAGLRAQLERRYPEALVVGCTTSGESLCGRHANGSATAAALYTPHVRWAAEQLAPLSSFQEDHARAAVARAFAKLDVDAAQLDASELVAVLLCDGLSRKEELVAAAVSEALEGVPLVGGSAGDDLAFARTQVSVAHETRSDAAALLVGCGPPGFYKVIKHQHFSTQPAAMAVTRADPATRRVYEIDGYPAADAYARALGITRAELADAAFLNPVLINVQGRSYVRSVQSIAEDGSITFYCAVDEGWILDLAGHHEMPSSLRDDLASLGGERSGFLIGFNCILRALEAEKRGLHDELGQLLEAVADQSIGFDTYGEVYDGLHINQTLIALALSRTA